MLSISSVSCPEQLKCFPGNNLSPHASVPIVKIFQGLPFKSVSTLFWSISWSSYNKKIHRFSTAVSLRVLNHPLSYSRYILGWASYKHVLPGSASTQFQVNSISSWASQPTIHLATHPARTVVSKTSSVLLQYIFNTTSLLIKDYSKTTPSLLLDYPKISSKFV